MTCLLCANGYYLPSNGVCTPVNPLCKSSDMTTGYCTLCYTGFILTGTTCVLAGPASIPYCANAIGSVCNQCINGYYVSNGTCAAANLLCATYNQSDGSCLSCISGYNLQDGNCIVMEYPMDPNCVSYNGSYCSACAPLYALINYFCTPIDPNCVQYDYVNNLCQACSKGKTPQGSNCI